LLILTLLTVSWNINAQEQMEIEGAVTIGDANNSTPAEGTIIWNPSTDDFEG